MKKIFYTVEKLLQQVDDEIEETIGLKIINIFEIREDDLVLLSKIEVPNETPSEETVKEWLSDIRPDKEFKIRML